MIDFKICVLEGLVCAAPSYIAQFGEPQTPPDLKAHRWIAASQREGTAIDVQLIGPDGSCEPLQVEPHVTSNNHLAELQMCAAGVGLALLLRADADDELRRGQLVPVLAGWRLSPLPVWVVTPQRDTQPAKVRHAIEALKAHFLTVPGASTGE